MHDWLDSYAHTLGVAPLTEEEQRTLLALAREVAHASERRFAPLSTFLAGVLAGSRADGAREEALRDAVVAAQALLGGEDTNARRGPASP
ncbi:MAG: molybdopterin-guanine dinucleotide biosynthesis protein MobA [Actinobacteria bacterium]|nr:molybdopterin-guanine dinucleotide biosynthesis protein MobA [Actinomycetota bacterium]